MHWSIGLLPGTEQLLKRQVEVYDQLKFGLIILMMVSAELVMSGSGLNRNYDADIPYYSLWENY